jgi:transmembrane sensor
MMDQNPNRILKDRFLADWISGKLSDNELSRLVSADDYKAYLQLRNSLGSLRTPDADIDANFAITKQKLIIGSRNETRRVRPLYYVTATAAVILLFIGLCELFMFSNTVKTGYGVTDEITLPDHSTVTLNSVSAVSYPSLFRFNRTLQLDGEAFFEVAKGSKFTVMTPHGDVEVLGTKFTVTADRDIFEVICFEGRVKVCDANNSLVLAPGEAVRFLDGRPEKWNETASVPQWTKGESGFRNTPLHHVIHQLENQYNVKILYPKKFTDIRFTGSFTHSNVETALQSVCIPLQLNYQQNGKGKIILTE